MTHRIVTSSDKQNKDKTQTKCRNYYKYNYIFSNTAIQYYHKLIILPQINCTTVDNTKPQKKRMTEKALQTQI